MKKMNKLFLSMMACMMVLTGCGKTDNSLENKQEKPEEATTVTKNEDVLIVYYSQSGNTEKIAERIQSLTGGDIYELEIENPYSEDMYETSDRAQEERDTQNYPELKGQLPKLDSYKTIYIGGPVWSHTLSSPLIQYLVTNDFTGKEIKPFWTDAGDPGEYEIEFQNYATTGNVSKGLGFSHVSSLNDTEMNEMITQWISTSTKITMTAGNSVIHAELNNTKAAQEFKELLPITLSMTRMGEHEYYSSLGTMLSEDDETQVGYEIGNLAYWTPGDLFAIYFDEPQEDPEGLIILGNVLDDIEKVAELGNPQEFTIALE